MQQLISSLFESVFSAPPFNLIFASLGAWAMLASESMPSLANRTLTPAEGFGFNFDIIETNILNLAVVIGVVFYLGGDVLNSLLNDRKQKILGTLKSANDRFLEAEQKLAEAKQKIEIAKTKAIEIRQQGKATAIQTTSTLFLRTEEEIQRLDESKKATLRFEEEKAIGLVRQQVVSLSIERAFSILKTKIDNSLQRRLIDTGVTQLGKL